VNTGAGPSDAAKRREYPLIEKVSIKRFKSIQEAELELGRVNIFIGSNGSGKSNVLEAIGVASAAVGRGIGDQFFLQKGVRVTPPPLMTSAFASAPDQDSFDLSVNMDNGVWYSARLMSSEDRFLTIVRETCSFGSAQVF